MVRFGQTQSFLVDSVGHGQTGSDSVGFGQIPLDSVGPPGRGPMNEPFFSMMEKRLLLAEVFENKSNEMQICPGHLSNFGLNIHHCFISYTAILARL